MDVIDLVSSSPPAAKQQISKARVQDTFRDIFSLDFDEFDSTDDFDFPSAQPQKRRKVSPLPETLGKQSAKADKPTLEPSLELSSDRDSLPCTQALLRSNDTAKVAATVSGINDVFHFSSSAPEPLVRGSPQRAVVFDLSSDHGVLERDPIQTSSQPAELSRPVFSQTTANLLANIRSNSSKIKSTAGKNAATSRSRRAASAEETRSDRFRRAACGVADDIIDSSQPGQTRKPQAKPKKQSVDANAGKSTAEQVTKEQKAALKEAERQRKQQEKEERQKEKQRAADIAEVNKSKTNKKNSTPEMIINIPSSLKGLSICNQVEEYMKELGVQLTFGEPSQDLTISGDAVAMRGSLITWKRKVIAEYDDDHEIWKPLAQPRVSNEAHVLIYLKAEGFVTLAVVNDSSNVTSAEHVSEGIMKQNLDAHVAGLRQRYPNCRLIYLIEGLSAWLRKSVNAKNRAYTAAVRAQTLENGDDTGDDAEEDANSALPSASRRKTKPTTGRQKKGSSNKLQIDLSSVTELTTEALLLHLQVHHQPLLIHHTTSPKTSAAQISTFTQHLSTRPYRLAAQSANLASASFCMTTGQIRTGTTATETWTQMLQEINRVTPSMAYGIAGAGYTNPSELVKAFRKDGRLMLEDVRKSTNKDGGWSDRRLGPMVSRRIYKVFMGKDPTAMDGMA